MLVLLMVSLSFTRSRFLLASGFSVCFATWGMVACSSDADSPEGVTGSGGESVAGSGGSSSVASGGSENAAGANGASDSGGSESGTGGTGSNSSGSCRSFSNGASGSNPCYVGTDGKAHCIVNDASTVTMSEVPGTAVSASGWDFTTRACVVSDAGAVYCGDYGALTEWIPSGATQVSGMADGHCAVVAGEVLCETKDTALETIDTGANAVELIGCFAFGCCAATVAQELVCWGNTFAALGTESTDPVLVALPEGKGVLQIAAAQNHICALLDGGQVQCWGQDWNGQLGGLGVDTVSGKTLEASNAVGVATGQFHTCIAYQDGTVRCAGEAGVHGAGQNSKTLALVPGIDSAVAITGGRYASCALSADGSVSCWGDFGSNVAGENETTQPLAVTGEKGSVCVMM